MYTSGRTVRSAKATKSPVQQATAEARKLVKRYLPDAQGVTVTSVQTADPWTLASQIRTTITYPETVDASDLACAVESMGRTTWTTVAITITRNI